MDAFLCVRACCVHVNVVRLRVYAPVVCAYTFLLSQTAAYLPVPVSVSFFFLPQFCNDLCVGKHEMVIRLTVRVCGVADASV